MEKEKIHLSNKTILKQCARGWYWFVLSFVLAFLLIEYFGKNSVLGKAEYKMGIMTRFSNEKTIALDEKDKMLWERVPAYDINQVSAIFMSSDIIERAGKAVGYDLNYTQKQRGRYIDVYNDLPYKLLFLDPYYNDTFTLTATLHENAVTLSDFQGTYHRKNLQSDEVPPIRVPLDDTISSPLGRIVCLSQSDMGRYPKTGYQRSQPVLVKKVFSNAAKTLFDKELDLHINSNNALIMEMSVQGSPRKVVEVMNKMTELCNEDIREMIRSDLSENDRFIDAAIVKLDKSPLPAAVKEKEKDVLLGKKLRNNSNKELLHLSHYIVVVDPPALRPAASASAYLKMVVLILALVGPLCIIYFCYLAHDRLLEEKQLPLRVKNSIIAKVAYKRINKKAKKYEDSLLCIDPIRLKFEKTNKLFLVSEGSNNKEKSFVKNMLATNFQRAGRHVEKIHFSAPNGNPLKDNDTIVIKGGMIGTASFHHLIEDKLTPTDKDALLIITADKGIQNLFLPYFQDFLLVLIENRSRVGRIGQTARQLEEQHTHHAIQQYAVWVETPLFFPLS